MDDTLAYEQGIQNPHIRGKLIKWPKQSEAALKAFLDQRDQLVEMKSHDSSSSHYALQEDWPEGKGEKQYSHVEGHKQEPGQNQNWMLQAPVRFMA